MDKPNIKDYALIAEVLGKQIGWMTEFGERTPLPLKGEDTYVCPKKNKTYMLKYDIIIGVD